MMIDEGEFGIIGNGALLSSAIDQFFGYQAIAAQHFTIG